MTTQSHKSAAGGREYDLVWTQGINVLREEIRAVNKKVDSLVEGMIASRRWVVGLVISLIPAYVTLGLLLFKR